VPLDPFVAGLEKRNIVFHTRVTDA